MEIRNVNEVPAFITKDGSEIREILAYRNSALAAQSLAQATVYPGKSTQEHHHPESEEIYYILKGKGRIRVNGESRDIGPGDAIGMLPGERICHKDTELVPIPARHQEHPLSLGCDLIAGGRRILYTGDTGWSDDLPARTRGADLFLCECTYFDSRSDTHLDYARLREHRDGFGARRIVLTHLGQEMLDHAAEVELEMAHDGMVIDL